MKPKTWTDSANVAIEGIIYAVKTERHMRYHLFAALAALILGLVLNITRTEFILLSMAIVLVLVTEMLNTAIEVTVDMISGEYHPLAKIAKDIAAGVVLIASIGALVLGVSYSVPGASGQRSRRGSGKYERRRSTLWPSLLLRSLSFWSSSSRLFSARVSRSGAGCRAVTPRYRSSIWIAALHLTNSVPIILVTFLACPHGELEQVVERDHRPIEVVTGAALGAGLTALFFWLFST